MDRIFQFVFICCKLIVVLLLLITKNRVNQNLSTIYTIKTESLILIAIVVTVCGLASFSGTFTSVRINQTNMGEWDIEDIE